MLGKVIKKIFLLILFLIIFILQVYSDPILARKYLSNEDYLSSKEEFKKDIVRYKELQKSSLKNPDKFMVYSENLALSYEGLGDSCVGLKDEKLAIKSYSFGLKTLIYLLKWHYGEVINIYEIISNNEHVIRIEKKLDLLYNQIDWALRQKYNTLTNEESYSDISNVINSDNDNLFDMDEDDKNTTNTDDNSNDTSSSTAQDVFDDETTTSTEDNDENNSSSSDENDEDSSYSGNGITITSGKDIVVDGDTIRIGEGENVVVTDNADIRISEGSKVVIKEGENIVIVTRGDREDGEDDDETTDIADDSNEDTTTDTVIDDTDDTVIDTTTDTVIDDDTDDTTSTDIIDYTNDATEATTSDNGEDTSTVDDNVIDYDDLISDNDITTDDSTQKKEIKIKIYLNDGSVISGTLLSYNHDSIVIKSYYDNIRIDYSYIKKIDYDIKVGEYVEIVLKNRDVIYGKVNKLTDTTISIEVNYKVYKIAFTSIFIIQYKTN
jgi:predicted DNA-binding antitoxin AbrB/MazE fold protein